MSITSNSKFAQEPRIKIRRSAFNQDHTYKTTFNNGSLVPIWWSEILPADTVSVDLSSVVRMSTPIKPIMDNIIQDTYYFFVPNRLIWKDWKRFMGELGPNEHWRQSSEATVPQFTFDDSASDPAVHAYWFKELTYDEFLPLVTRWNQGLPCIQLAYSSNGGTTKTTLASNTSFIPNPSDPNERYYVEYVGPSPESLSAYLGLPQGSVNYDYQSGGSMTFKTVSQLPFRAYCLIWNEYFRDQNYMDPCDIRYDDNTTVGLLDVHGNTDISLDQSYDLKQWYTDYVNKAVRGAALLPVCRFHDYFSSALPQPQRGDPALIPTSLTGTVPVLFDQSTVSTLRHGALSSVYWFDSNGSNLNTSLSNDGLQPIGLGKSNLGNYGGLQTKLFGTVSDPTSVYSKLPYVSAYTDFDHANAALINSSTINDLRTAFQVQKYLELSARTGTRYIEVIEGFFGVKNPDSRIQRPEFLEWKRDYINVTQVLQTSSTDSTSPQGNTAAYSLTTTKNSAFTKSFTEHGIIMALTCTRTSRSYQQGYNKLFMRERKFDYYWPQFAHLGEQPIYNYEIFTSIGNNELGTYNNQVFGYQERYAEYKYHPDLVTGQFSSNGPQPLDFWHFADSSMTPVYMSKEWLFEGPEQLDRCLAVTSDQSHQFQADFYVNAKFVRPMPLYSIPGLADHF